MIFFALGLLVAILFLFEGGAKMRGYIPPLDYVIAALIAVGTVLLPIAVLIFLLKYRFEIIAAMYANPKRWFGIFAKQLPRLLVRLAMRSLRGAVRPLIFAGLVVSLMFFGFWLIQSWNLSAVEISETSGIESVGEEKIGKYSREIVLAVAASSAFTAYLALRVVEWIYGVMATSFVRYRPLMQSIILKLLQQLGILSGLRFLARAPRRIIITAGITLLASTSIGYFFGPRALHFVSGIFAASPIITFIFVGVASGIFIGAIFILLYHAAITRGG